MFQDDEGAEDTNAFVSHFCSGIWNGDHQEVLRTQREFSDTFLHDEDTQVV